jgi:hypothetical protein
MSDSPLHLTDLNFDILDDCPLDFNFEDSTPLNFVDAHPDLASGVFRDIASQTLSITHLDLVDDPQDPELCEMVQSLRSQQAPPDPWVELSDEASPSSTLATARRVEAEDDEDHDSDDSEYRPQPRKSAKIIDADQIKANQAAQRAHGLALSWKHGTVTPPESYIRYFDIVKKCERKRLMNDEHVPQLDQHAINDYVRLSYNSIKSQGTRALRVFSHNPEARNILTSPLCDEEKVGRIARLLRERRFAGDSHRKIAEFVVKRNGDIKKPTKLMTKKARVSMHLHSVPE